MKSLKKSERLNSKKLIELLYNRKTYSSISVAPFRLTWALAELPTTHPAQILFSVPKKLFPKAADRNRIRRKMREAYRNHKEIIYHFLINKKQQTALNLVYMSMSEISYPMIEKKIILLLQRFTKEYKSYDK